MPKVSAHNTGPVRTPIFRYLDTNGDGTGTKNAIGEYHDAGDGAEIFYIQPPAGEVYRLVRMMIHVADAGSFDSGKYGNNVVLTNGITIRLQDDSGTVVEYTDGVPIKANPHWNRMCYDVTVSGYGSGDESLNSRWTFTKSGYPIRLRGNNNERFEIVLNDDFSDLKEQYFLMQGYEES